jgi:hypothetical protein
LIVLPRPGRLAPTWQRLLRPSEGVAAGARRRTGVQEGDFYGLRDWRSGDPRNRIHWRTSARRQTLTVRQYERRRQSELLLVVDLWEPEKSTDADRARTESVLSFAATVLNEVCREAGSLVHIELVAKRPRTLQGAASSQFLEEAWQMLAAAEPTSHDALPKSLAAALGDQSSQANVVVAATRPAELLDRNRFAELYDRPHLQGWTSRIVALSPNTPPWSEVFREAP